MNKELTIIDKDYIRWVEDLSVRYRQSQIRAAVRVNRELLKYYWELGRDIEEMHVEERWGEKVIKNLSVDLQRRNPNATGLSVRNIYYCKQFYLLYHQYFAIMPQTVAQLEGEKVPQGVAVSKSCPTSCGTITRWKSATTCGRIFEVCSTGCGTIGRNAFFNTLGTPPLLDGQVQQRTGKGSLLCKKDNRRGMES